MSLTLCVLRKNTVTDQITEFTLGSPAERNSLPSYTAGAHIDIDLGDEIGSRSYSLIDWSGPPAAPDSYTITVQLEADGDGGSKRMHELAAGDSLSATTPSNDFELADSTAPAMLIAGGIGITPLISMAASLAQDNKPFQLYYAGRSKAVMAYADRLEDSFGDQVKIHTDDNNPLPIDTLFSTIDPATHVYICCPAGLLDATRAAASAAGVAAEQIHTELFATPEAKSTDVPFEVELNSTGDVYVIPPGQTIIEVLEAAGHDLMYDCQRGDCGICQTAVISGTPDHRDVVLSDDEKASGKVMQICVSRAGAERLVLDL